MRSFLFSMAASVVMFAAAGCTAEAVPTTGCDVDDDCAEGLHCGPGGCRADCRADRDCVALGLSAICTARGRCESGLDAGVDGSTGPCAGDWQCDDGVYCNGAEVCTPTDLLADARGCVGIPSTCAAGDCDEATDTCDPCRVRDADHDGYDSTRCGGPDCDDTNAAVGPGRGELCDAAGIDEDCNPATLGAVTEDQDGDGFWPSMTPVGTPCCNGTVCGTDCADVVGPGTFARDRFPGARETCNGLDDDCNGVIDEVSTWVYVDCDGDGFGDNLRTGRQECPRPATAAECPAGAATAAWVDQVGDCDDAVASTHNGATDVCNGVNDDCSGPVDPPECACINGSTGFCGYSAAAGLTRCSRVNATCVGGSLNCPSGLITGAELETCDGVDENCNGDIDEGVAVRRYYRDADTDGYGDDLVYIDACLPPTGYLVTGGDCHDSDPAAHTTAAPNCDRAYDQDCVNGLDNTQWTTCNSATDPDNPSFHTCTGRQCAGVGTCAVAVADSWYRLDGDNDRDCTGAAIARCVGYPVPGGYRPVGECRPVTDDCNDGQTWNAYGYVEIPDGRDNDCDGVHDNGLRTRHYVLHAPGDEYNNMLSDNVVEAGWISRYWIDTYNSYVPGLTVTQPLIRCYKTNGRHYITQGDGNCAAPDEIEGYYGYLLATNHTSTTLVHDCYGSLGGDWAEMANIFACSAPWSDYPGGFGYSSLGSPWFP